ncbi:hypothetical protein [Nonomuraea sp. NPDC050540]|uniref:hypothetical protein n=1 Tax=Nonomuraea sp. NPDC050540 TaxID=3364367 RepID=UPI0037AAD2A9
MKPLKSALKRWGTLGVTTAFAVGVMITGATPPAQASEPCTWGWIIINDGPGAEPASQVRGHRHATGNHYIGSWYITNQGDYVWSWWADNNGGKDGDTEDTYQGWSACPYKP